MIDKNIVLDRAQNECIAELFARSQPPLDYQQLLNDIDNGVEYDELYNEHHYISLDDYHTIVNNFIDAFGFDRSWENNIDLVNGYFSGFGTKAFCIPGYIDDDGNIHEAIYTFENMPHIKHAINDILLEYGAERSEEISDKISDKIFEYLMSCKDLYELDTYADLFNARIAFSKTPTQDKNKVIEYWKSKGVDLIINENCSDLGVTD